MNLPIQTDFVNLNLEGLAQSWLLLFKEGRAHVDAPLRIINFQISYVCFCKSGRKKPPLAEQAAGKVSVYTYSILPYLLQFVLWLSLLFEAPLFTTVTN